MNSQFKDSLGTSVAGLLCALVVQVLFFAVGCAESAPTVIRRTVDYQLTEQEQKNKLAEIEARKRGGV